MLGAAVGAVRGETLASIPLPQQAAHAALTPDGRKLYVTFGSGPEAAAVIDTLTYSLTPSTGSSTLTDRSPSQSPVTRGATTIGVRPDGQVAYFAHSAIKVVDTATDEVIGSIAPGLGDNVGSIDFTPDEPSPMPCAPPAGHRHGRQRCGEVRVRFRE